MAQHSCWTSFKKWRHTKERILYLVSYATRVNERMNWLVKWVDQRVVAAAMDGKQVRPARSAGKFFRWTEHSLGMKDAPCTKFSKLHPHPLPSAQPIDGTNTFLPFREWVLFRWPCYHVKSIFFGLSSQLIWFGPPRSVHVQAVQVKINQQKKTQKIHFFNGDIIFFIFLLGTASWLMAVWCGYILYINCIPWYLTL